MREKRNNLNRLFKDFKIKGKKKKEGEKGKGEKEGKWMGKNEKEEKGKKKDIKGPKPPLHI